MPDLDAAIRARLARRSRELPGMSLVGRRHVTDWCDTAEAAVLAVLDKHPNNHGHCETCFVDVTDEWGSPVVTYEPWPCPTVRAVAKELSVEVPHDSR